MGALNHRTLFIYYYILLEIYFLSFIIYSLYCTNSFFWPGRVMFSTALATMNFYFVLLLIFLILFDPNRTTVSSSHRHEHISISRFSSLGYHSTSTWVNLATCPANAELLLPVHHDHVLHSARELSPIPCCWRLTSQAKRYYWREWHAGSRASLPWTHFFIVVNVLCQDFILREISSSKFCPYPLPTLSTVNYIKYITYEGLNYTGWAQKHPLISSKNS